MAKSKDSGDPTEIPTQSDEAREAVLAGAVQGGRTATGQAIEQASGAEDERLADHDEHGSTRPIAGGDSLQADFPPHESAEPVGLQAKPAAFASNGTLQPAMVASPTGLIPVSAVASNAEDANRAVQEHFDAVQRQLDGRRSAADLTEDEINRLDGPTLRAIAAQEGWDIGQNGTRTARRRFINERNRSSRETAQTTLEANAGSGVDGSSANGE